MNKLIKFTYSSNFKQEARICARRASKKSILSLCRSNSAMIKCEQFHKPNNTMGAYILLSSLCLSLSFQHGPDVMTGSFSLTFNCHINPHLTLPASVSKFTKQKTNHAW